MFLADRLRRRCQIGYRFGGFGLGRRSQIVGNRRNDSLAGLTAFCSAQVVTTTPATAAAAPTAARTAFAIRVLLGARFAILIVLLVVTFIAFIAGGVVL